MANFKINIGKSDFIPVLGPQPRIGSEETENTFCESSFSVIIKNRTPVVVDWVDLSPIQIEPSSIVKTSGNMTAVNGEILNDETTEYQVTIRGFKSSNDYYNTNLSGVYFSIKDPNTGDELGFESIGRNHNGQDCNGIQEVPI